MEIAHGMGLPGDGKPARTGLVLMPGRNGEKPAAEKLSVNGVRPRPQHSQNAAVQNGDTEVELILPAPEEENAQLQETGENTAIRRQKTETNQRCRSSESQQDPNRGHHGPMCGSIDQQGRSNGNPQNKERCARHSRREHGEQSLHNYRLGVAIRLGNLERGVERRAFRMVRIWPLERMVKMPIPVTRKRHASFFQAQGMQTRFLAVCARICLGECDSLCTCRGAQS